MKFWRKLWGTKPAMVAPHGIFDDSVESAALVLDEVILETLRHECDRKFPHETGGVLVGHVASDGLTIVSAVVGPGPNALHARSRFTRDGEYAQIEVDRIYRESDGRDDYIGEWHSHPDAGGPSFIDRGSMSWISDNPLYGRNEPVLIIVERARTNEWRPRAFRWIARRLIEVQTSTPVDPKSQ